LAMHGSCLPKSHILAKCPPLQLHLQGMCLSLNKRQGDMKLKALVGHNYSSVGNGGMLHRTRLQEREMPTDCLLMASVAACACNFQLPISVPSNTAWYITRPKYVANSGLSLLHDPSLNTQINPALGSPPTCAVKILVNP
jgi:hypothetical protein